MEDVGFQMTFIREVENHPCLWNYTLRTYNKPEETSLAWKEIAKNVKDSEASCRERWKNMRCAFVRSRRPPKPGSKAKKKYYLSKNLSFLIPYLKEKCLPANLNIKPEPDYYEDESTPWVQTFECQAANDSMSNNITHETSFDQRSDEAEEPHQTQKTAFEEWLKKCRCEKEKDADMLFFESLLPDVRQLTNQSKRRFKADVLHLLNNALDETERVT